MSSYLKICLVIFGLAYFLSPMDIIPEYIIPYLGWIDDSLILGIILYMIRYNRLPNFSYFFKNGPSGNRSTTEEKRSFSNTKKAGPSDKTHSKRKREEQRKQTDRTPYDILGVSHDASSADIDKAYKEAIKKYHPDKLSHLGEEFAHLANKKFLEIQKAYDILLKNR